LTSVNKTLKWLTLVNLSLFYPINLAVLVLFRNFAANIALKKKYQKE